MDGQCEAGLDDDKAKQGATMNGTGEALSGLACKLES